MLESNKGRRRLLVGVMTVGLTLGASAAYAFWSGGGEADGSAVVGLQGGGVLEVRQIGQPLGLSPGGTARDITIQVTNPGPDAMVFYGVTVVVQPGWTFENDESVATPPCKVDDFDVHGHLFPGGLAIAGQDTTTLHGSIVMRVKAPTPGFTGPVEEDPNNQDACRGATVPLVLTPLYSPPPPAP